MTIPPLDPTMLAALLQSGPAASTAAVTTAGAFPTMPVSAIEQAQAKLAAQQSGGMINNLDDMFASTGATPTTGGLSGLGGMEKKDSFGDRLAKVKEETPQHHALVASNAQFVPLERETTNPYAPTAPSSLFDMLKSMYGAQHELVRAVRQT